MSLERTKERRPDLYEAYVAAHAEEFAPKKPKRRRKKKTETPVDPSAAVADVMTEPNTNPDADAEA